ncbi:MAG TPA: ADP-ribosylglycohydrolase family protein [Verrucomicrobiae bacterium]|jgi:ADP-ribosylglycohydrolase|nr:ADP-ribosylglycohydrolase family protein [Verrucomicrobiae bacterium]
MTTSVRISDLQERFTGLLLGTAVGDALGLPAENLSAEQARRRWNGEWKMRFVFGKGMVSDDTEHTLAVAQALLAHSDDSAAFQRALAWKLRWWFAGLPGGVGLATARACIKLWVGFPTSRSAVVSAGSGPAMRSAIIGAYFAGNPEKRKKFVLASSRLTHRSWQAETAALAVAESVALAITNSEQDTSQILTTLGALSLESEWQKIMLTIKNSLAAGHSVPDFVDSLKLKRGVTGYSLHVVPVALYAWLHQPNNFRAALTSALDCGGDTDTVGAILGALSGIAVGKSGIPVEWIDNIWEWPRSVLFMEKVAARLATQNLTDHPAGSVSYFWPAVIFRNIFFLGVVLVHGFRRLAPPY